MSTKFTFIKLGSLAVSMALLSASLCLGAHGGGGHGGGGHGGGGHGGGGGFHAGGGAHGGGSHGASHAASGFHGAAHGASSFHAGAGHGGGRPSAGAIHGDAFRSFAPSHAFNANGFAGHHPSYVPGHAFNTFGSGRGRESFLPAHSLNANGFAHSGNWAGRYGGWNGWGGRNGDWHGGGGWGGYWPWYSGLGLGLGWGYPYAYNYYYPYSTYYYPDSGYYDPYSGVYSYPSLGINNSYSYAPSVYGTGTGIDPVVTAPQIADSAVTPPAAPGENGLAAGTGVPQGSEEAAQYYADARAAFSRGDYQETLRLAGHAGIDEPQNPKVHELISLALFAMGNYPAAAGEAHAALALGSIPDWKGVFSYYNDPEKYTAQLAELEKEKYTTQLRALEKALAENPNSAAEHFLLGYHYLAIGARDQAKPQFAAAMKLTPDDQIAKHYLDELQSGAPLTPPQMAARPQGTAL